MEIDWNVLRAMLHCHYKAWLLVKNGIEQSVESNYPAKLNTHIDSENRITLPVKKITPHEKIIVSALYLAKAETTVESVERVQILYDSQTSAADGKAKYQSVFITTSRYADKAKKLLDDVRLTISKSEPPSFYRNPHCPICQFRDSCYKKLKERDCISLLGGVSEKVLKRFHSKGIFSITQLSHTFRPRRRGRKPHVSGNFLWELKALAIREKKTFVIHPPELEKSSAIIYLDFEGVPEENWIYLIGGIVKQEGKQDETFSYWADSMEDEKEIFQNLFKLLEFHHDAPIYHYGSYEIKALRHAAKKWSGKFKKELPDLEKRMVNILGYLRTHVYPPIYSNGLKELAGFLDFHWTEKEADGLRSLLWRKEWESKGEAIWKEKLLQYNQDDCRALERVCQWFRQLEADAELKDVQQVAEMKKVSPYKFHNNPEYSEDFSYINKAAYFDYQRNKIYWRNQKGHSRNAVLKIHHTKLGKGIAVWKPKKVNEIIIAPPLNKCPRCGSKRIYHLKEKITVVRQTDLKFTPIGMKRWVREFRSGRIKCANCNLKLNNRNLRMLLYGDNLFAWAINFYVRYHISHYKVARLLGEQFGIWINPMYLIQRKHKWWNRWKPEVDYLWEIIKSSPVIHIDETTVRLSQDKGYVWAFATPHTVFYHFTLNRESDFLHHWLKDYKGVIVTDFFSGYESLPVKQQRCLVHLIRDLNDDLFKNPFDEEYKMMVSAFGTLLRKIIETIDHFGLKKNHLQKHLKDVDRYYRQILESKHQSELSIKCAKRLRKHWDELWTFLHYDDVAWNNNNAETAIKAFAQHRQGVNGQMNEKGARQYLEMLSIAQTCRYRNLSFLDFLRRKVGIWENINPKYLPSYLPFAQARLFIQKLGFQRKKEWDKWKQSGKRPIFIPSSPERVYREKGWVNWHDWLEFDFMPFNEARTYMRKLRLKNRKDYWAWLSSRKRPKFIPYSPEKVYRYTGWDGLGDWLGTGNKRPIRKTRMSYEQAKAFVQSLGIRTQKEFFDWRKKERPDSIPPDPFRAYQYEFEGWGKFLGTNRIANQNKKYWSYEEAKSYLKSLQINSYKHFRQLCNEGFIPVTIPKSPYAYFKKQGTWMGFTDFFSKAVAFHSQ